MLMQTSTGRIILMNSGVSAICATPYRNKYGEEASEDTKNYEEYVIDELGGGRDALNKLRKSYMNFTIANDVLQARTNPNSKFRVFLKNTF